MVYCSQCKKNKQDSIMKKTPGRFGYRCPGCGHRIKNMNDFYRERDAV